VRPSPRASVGAFDEARARVVLVGYSGPYFNNMLSDTWEWDGAQWHAFPASVPPRELIQLGPGTYRHETGRVAMASRASGTFFEWNGSAWNATSIQYGGGLIVSDPVRGVIIAYPDMATLAAGCHWESSDLLAHAERYGNGCANGPTPGLMALGRAEPGEAGFTLALQTFAPSAPSLLGIAFDAGNQDLGNGCTALLANAVGSSFAMSDSGGEARWTMPVPNDVHLLGLSFRAQGAVLDPPHGLLGAVTLSDGLHIAVGN
jgi:hypothetical protein